MASGIHDIKISIAEMASWTGQDRIPHYHEICIERETKRIKIGDGTTLWKNLPYWAGFDINSWLTNAGVIAAIGFTPSSFDGVYSSLSGKPSLFDGVYNSLSGKPSLFDGNYNSLSNLPSLYSPSVTFNASPGRALSTTGSNNTFTISTTKNARVAYTVSFAVILTLIPPLTSSAIVQLDYSVDSGSNWIPVSDVSQAYGAALALTNTTRIVLGGDIPANALTRIYNITNTNTTTSITKQQEITYS